MNTQNVTKFIKTIQNGVVKHSPEILTGLGIAGMITTTVLAVKATPKALRLIEEAEHAKAEKIPNEPHKLTPVETAKAAWKPYIPAVVTGVTSTACLIGGLSVSARRNAALATAYQLSTTALNEYKEKVVETVGETTAKEVREKIVQDKQDKIAENKTIIFAGDDDYLIYEPLSNQYFRSTANKIDAAVNYLNGRMIDGCEMYISLNEFLNELGLKNSAVGHDLGWSVHKRIDLTYDDGRDEKGRPCAVIAYLQPPFHDFDKLY